MKLCVIAPTPMLFHTTYGDMHFVLAQKVLKEEKYALFYHDEQKYKLMDNGIYEKEILSVDQLLDAAEICKADEVAALDTPGDPEKTLQQTSDFISVCPKKFKIMGIPHGKTFAEYVHSYMALSQLPDIHCIGFSILDLWKFEGKQRIRPLVIRYLVAKDILSDEKEHHLLGLDEPLELFSYFNLPIRSVDTSMPMTFAFHGKQMEYEQVKQTRIPDDGKIENTVLVIDNIRWLKHIANSMGL